MQQREVLVTFQEFHNYTIRNDCQMST
jgi:hypothetical protein